MRMMAPSLRRAVSRLPDVYAEARRLRALFTRDTWVLAGRLRDGGEPFCFAFSGSPALKEYQARLCFSGDYKEHDLGPRLVHTLPLTLGRRFPDCALSIVEVSGPEGKAHRLLTSDLKNPVSMPLEITIAGSLEESVSRAWLKRVEKHISEHRLTCEARTDEASFADFYHTMYLPFVTVRHGRAAMPADYEGLRNQCRSGELLLIRAGTLPIGGCLVDFGRAKARFLQVGVRDGSDQYMRMGVPGAAYYFRFQRMLERGGGTADLGPSRGFLKDGPLQYKLSIGALFADRHYEPAGFLHFRFLRPSPGLRRFLIDNPLLTVGPDGRYHATFFADDPRAGADIRKNEFPRYARGSVRPRLLTPPSLRSTAR